MGYSDYMKMPFDELFHLVFTDSGCVKACGRDACQAMIERLEKAYGQKGTFGDAEHGNLTLPYAFTVAKGLF